MKKKLINKNWNKQRDITPDMFCLKNKQNENYLNHLRDSHDLPMSELINACRLMVTWIPDIRQVENLAMDKF